MRGAGFWDLTRSLKSRPRPGSIGFDHDYSEETGAFGQYTRELSSLLVLEGGPRVDSHSDYGSFILPRVSLLVTPTEDLTMRLGGVTDTKPLTYLSPKLKKYSSETRTHRSDNVRGETSRGLNFDINHRAELSEELTLNSNLLLFYTEIDDALQIVENGGVYQFNQQNTAVETQGTELNLTFGFGEFRYLFGYTYVDARQETPAGDTAVPLVSVIESIRCLCGSERTIFESV